MNTTSELKPLLKRLKLGAMMDTLPERLALARHDQLDYAAFLEILLADEIARRDNRNLELRLQKAGFEEVCRLEDFDWDAGIKLDRRLIDQVFSLEFLNCHEHVLFVGPVGVGKSFLAQALGHQACRAGYNVLFIKANRLLSDLGGGRADDTWEKRVQHYLKPHLLILDDFGLQRLTAQQSTDLYELIIARHRKASFVMTSNRAIDEWLGLFDDPVLGNSALDRLANASYQIVIDGASYRERQSPHRRKEALT